MASTGVTPDSERSSGLESDPSLVLDEFHSVEEKDRDDDADDDDEIDLVEASNSKSDDEKETPSTSKAKSKLLTSYVTRCGGEIRITPRTQKHLAAHPGNEDP